MRSFSSWSGTWPLAAQSAGVSSIWRLHECGKCAVHSSINVLTEAAFAGSTFWRVDMVPPAKLLQALLGKDQPSRHSHPLHEVSTNTGCHSVGVSTKSVEAEAPWGSGSKKSHSQDLLQPCFEGQVVCSRSNNRATSPQYGVCYEKSHSCYASPAGTG